MAKRPTPDESVPSPERFDAEGQAALRAASCASDSRAENATKPPSSRDPAARWRKGRSPKEIEAILAASRDSSQGEALSKLRVSFESGVRTAISTEEIERFVRREVTDTIPAPPDDGEDR